MKYKLLFSQFIVFFITGISQDLLRFSTSAINTNDLTTITSVKSFGPTDPIFFAFELHEIQKMKLHEHESLIICFKVLDNGVQPIEEYKVIATQDENGIVRGNGVILPQLNNLPSYEINTIFKDDFHYRFLQKMEEIANQKSKWKLVIEEYRVSVHDNLKKRGVAIDFGVMSEDVGRFPQFTNKMMPNFTMKKPVSFTMELTKNYPFSEITKITNDFATAKKDAIYEKLSSETKAPSDYLSNDFKGYENEITRAQLEKLASKFFEGTAYQWSNLSYFSNEINVNKNELGIPTYKYFYIGFYAKKNDGKCAFGTITIRSEYAGGGKYGNWKTDTYKLTDCKCE
jgi:hypothetical protein